METSSTDAGLFRGVEEKGGYQRGVIDNLLNKFGIDMSDIAPKGVLALDVGEGPEIAAFAPYHPDPFVVTERAMSSGSRLWGNIDESLRIMKAHHPSVRILRDTVLRCMDQLSRKHGTFGLVTYLYMFREDGNSYYHLKHAFTLMGSLVKPGGVALASLEWVDEMESYGSNFYRAGYTVFKNLGFRIDSPTIKGGTSAGGLFLVAQKPS